MQLFSFQEDMQILLRSDGDNFDEVLEVMENIVIDVLTSTSLDI
jgi:hypothetical protein